MSGPRCDAEGRVMCRQLLEQIDIAGHQMVLGNDPHRLTKFRQHLQASPVQPQATFDRLITVGHCAHRQRDRPVGQEESGRKDLVGWPRG